MRLTIPAGAMVLLLLVVGCGGGSTDSVSTGATAAGSNGAPPSRASAVAAEAICSEMIAKSQRMGAEFAAAPNLSHDALVLTTRNLIKPAIPIVEDSSRQLRSLTSEAKSVDFDAYVSIFDPIVATLRQRVAAGEEREPTRAHELELQLVDLVDLQRSLARKVGLKACDVDFIQTFAGGTAP